MARHLELGLDTFGDVTLDDTGRRSSYAQVIRDVVEQGVLADEVGVDFFGVGEHHRDDYAVSTPETVLAAIAARTSRIKLGSAVTVLSSDDPVRVFQRFATIDAISNGRAEVMLGRGSFTESFPLFGYELKDYSVLFEEKLQLFAALLEEGPVTWQGTLRPGLQAQDVYPKTEAGRIKTWVGVGGSPESVVRAASYGLPLLLAIIGGDPVRFAPYADLFRRALGELGKEPQPIGVHSPGFIADTDEEAREIFWPHYETAFGRIGRERGFAAPSPQGFVEEIEHGALAVGSPETVARKIARTATALDLDRFDLKYTSGAVPHSRLMHSIRLYGERVVPRVRELVAESSAA
jgi:probable LLM family oxidoreductase